MAKNIVLLSDGTGNSSAQLLKTNVWRIYEALQLTDPSRQVACYDDGVGTSSFKPLAVAGGAFGIGLRRNVLRLYRFLCEHYDPGDRLYFFGFSRGAFTVRVLVGLICDQGIIRTRPTLPVPGSSDAPLPDTRMPHRREALSGVAVADAAPSFDGLAYGSELTRLSAWAYRDFRKHFNQTGGLVTLARKVRDKGLGVIQRGRPYDKSRNHQVDAIDFVGVWDTVDAYGLPVDELTQGVDRWVWPLSMPDLTLNDKVKRACHVLALDDERNTFHPVLWDESTEPAARREVSRLADERISQVWFAGMHSNVGGGYPDDALSYVSLKWMTEQATDEERGMKLLFVPELLQHHTRKADPFGRIYDSRRGLKSYYRYNPRRIQWLTDGQRHEHGLARPAVTVERPKIHESVFRRIAAAPEAYAPIVFPEHYAVVMEDGRIVAGEDNPFEPPLAAKRRATVQEAAWDLVWQRRLVYFATVAASLYLLIQPLRHSALDGAPAEAGSLARLIALAGSWLPSFASPWIHYYEAHPNELLIGAGVILVLMWRSTALQSRICGLMRGVWLKVVPPARGEWQSLDPRISALTRLRSSRNYQWTFAFLRRKVLPNVTGFLILAWLAGAANRAPFEALQAFGLWGCRAESGREATLATGASTTVRFASADFCTPSGVRLERGARYRLAFEKGLPADWIDGTVRVASPAGVTVRTPGLTLGQRVVYTVGVPFRRLWTTRWFVPVARVGASGIEHHALSSRETEIVPETTGELFLFVNDSIAPVNIRPRGLGWRSYYGSSNQGVADVTVTRLADPPPAVR
jgi:hypothetical protein